MAKKAKQLNGKKTTAVKQRRTTTKINNNNNNGTTKRSFIAYYGGRTLMILLPVVVGVMYYRQQQQQQTSQDPLNITTSTTTTYSDSFALQRARQNNPTPLQKPGDLNEFFLRMITDKEVKERYRPIIYSYPKNIDLPAGLMTGSSSIEDDDDDSSSSSSSIVDDDDGPWLVLLQNVLTTNECHRIIQLVDLDPRMKFERSTNFTGGTWDVRTSESAWCRFQCLLDDTIRTLHEKIMNITEIPEENYEYLQILKYEKGQYYNTHSDYFSGELQKPQGVRILTIFFYLNDVEAGGGTNFPQLNNNNNKNLTVVPKMGNVLIWPSVLNTNPNSRDERTLHSALPVTKGIKYAANLWIHQNKFKLYNVKDVLVHKEQL